MKFLFVAIAGSETGYGHLNRCLTLAKHARSREIISSFLVFGDAAVQKRIELAGFPCVVHSHGILEGASTRIMDCWNEDIDAVVVDFTHPLIFRNIEGSQALLWHIHKHTRILMVIDSLGGQTLALRIPDMPADVIALPYVGAEIMTNVSWRALAGPEYAVLASNYNDLPSRCVHEHADRLLISCGGSDPRWLTLLVLDGIEQITLPLFVRVVVGPLFNRGLADTLADRVSGSHHSIELIKAPEDLAEHMLWCDLAVAASGLIKYELAASSTPAILMSIDSGHDEVNRPFLRMGTARDLGVEFSAESVADVVAELLGDRESRAAMAEAGRQLVDGKGADRLITDLVRACNVA